MIKAFSIDLDGTLLDSNKNISAFTKDQIAEAKKRGYQIILSSGRHYSEMEYYIRELKLGDSDKIICCDGVYITHYNGKIIYQNSTLSAVDLIDILNYIKNTDLYFYTENKNYLICNSLIKWIKVYLYMFMKKNRETCLLMHKDISRCHHLFIEKVVIPKSINIETFNNLKRRYTIHCLKNGRTEILSMNVSKYSALKQLEKMGMIDISTVVCFGDDMNDMECFENIIKCIAMGNSMPYLKKNALFITKTNDEDGVGVVLQQVLNGIEF